MDTREQIRQHIATNLLYSPNGFPLRDDASFLEKGVVDSQGIMELVMFIEEQFGIAVADEDVIPDHFDSVNNLVAYVEARNGTAY
jgi:acyl carrier protein